MTDDVSRVPSLLYDIQTSSTENALTSLSILNEIISTSEQEREFLYKIGGFHLLINAMKNDKLVNVCLKIFANACKKDERVRRELIKADIIYLLGNQLRNECDFSKGSMVLYSALIVILVQGNQNVQNQMKVSGCLSSLIRILNRILEETEHNVILLRNTELIIYAIATCIKDPRHAGNQTEVGWTTAKVNESSIVDYLRKRTIFENEAQLQVVRCLWSLLRSVIDKNEINQRIFINYLGFIVLFRSMQEILDEEKQDVMGSLLSKMTGLLVKLKSHKEFLCQASNYCSVMILCGLLKSTDGLVLHHIITFLDSLTQEIPEVLDIIKDKDVVKAMARAKIVLFRSKASVSVSRDFWARVGLGSKEEGPSREDFPTQEDLNLDDVMSHFNFSQSPQNYFCLLHGTNKEVQVYSLNRNGPRLDACRSEKERRMRRMVESSFVLPRRDRNRFNVMKFLGRGVFAIFQKFWTLLKGRSNDTKLRQNFLNDEYLTVDDRLYDYYKGIPFKI